MPTVTQWKIWKHKCTVFYSAFFFFFLPPTHGPASGLKSFTSSLPLLVFPLWKKSDPLRRKTIQPACAVKVWVSSLWFHKQRWPFAMHPGSVLSIVCFSGIILAIVSARAIHYFSYLLCCNSHCPVNIRLESLTFLPFNLASIQGSSSYMSLILCSFNGVS